MTSPPSPLSSSPRSHPPQTSRRLHPAYVAGEIEVEESKRELAVQEAYTPDSQCFGCGPASRFRPAMAKAAGGSAVS